MLEGVKLVKSVSGQKIIDGVDIQLAPGEISVVIGPSGSGKTTLLKLLAMLEKPDSGTVIVDDTHYTFPVSGAAAAHKKQSPPWPKITVVFQQLFLWPHLTLLQNIKLPLDLRNSGAKKSKQQRRKTDAGKSSTKEPVAEPASETASEPATWTEPANDLGAASEQRRLEDLIELFDMQGFVNRYPNEASLGQRQRAALVRALILEPKYILLDEITSSLDVEQVAIILSYLKRLAKKGIGILIVTHLLNFARDAADKVIFVDSGQIIESGGREVLDAPTQERVKKFLSVIESAS